MNWEQKFTGRILSRGYDYWRHGYVTDLSREDDDTYVAEVQGSETHKVTVKKDFKGQILLSCDCPYSEESYCWHMAAALYEIEDSDSEFLDSETEKPEIKIAETMHHEDFPFPSEDSFFNLNPITDIYKMNDAEYSKAVILINSGKAKLTHCRCVFAGGDDSVCLDVSVKINDNGTFVETNLKFTRNKLMEFNCSGSGCIDSDFGKYYFNKGKTSGFLCAHKIAAMILVARYIKNENPGDYSDSKGIRLLNAVFTNQTGNIQRISLGQNSSVTLGDVPVDILVHLENGPENGVFVTYSIQRTKNYILRDPQNFFDSYNSQIPVSFGKNLVINFKTAVFTPRAQACIEFFSRIAKLGMSIERETYLSQGLADDFFDLFENTDVMSADGKPVEFTEGKLEFDTKITPLVVLERTEGITLDFCSPNLIEGMRFYYYYNKETNKYVKIKKNSLGPLADIILNQRSSNFSCSIGRHHLSDFISRILPALKTYGKVDFSECPDLSDWKLPEPEFSFNLDYNDQTVTCRTFVTYGENSFDMSEEIVLSKKERDIFRENTVSEQLDEIFEIREKGMWSSSGSDGIYLLLSQGLPILMGMGTVNGSSSFNSLRVRHSTKAKTQVSVEGNLLELDIQTEDMSVQELLELIESYRQHKVYHRLKDGSFIDIDNREVANLAEFFSGLDLENKELIKGKIHLPAYRALYIDRLMKDRETLNIDKDSSFRRIIRDFDTFRDSDAEIPSSLSGILRNYQIDGFRWINTLAHYGFGGILADEMGLGKTVEILSYILFRKQAEEKTGTTLIICPASLVYNWQAEIEKFTPQLSVTLIVGKQKEREELIKNCHNFDVAITSYDLLKRDIPDYREKQFDLEVIDEAQFIKNSDTEASKAVKLINSKFRFALTGTPIENRISELWSIFDYLMPGFLFRQETFRRDFEIPIMKEENNYVMERLVRMTSPFILRRLKTDVLKDLPDKLEESRFAELTESQRKLYDAQLTKIKVNLSKTSNEEFNKSKIQILAEITRLRQICCDPALAFEGYEEQSAKRLLCSDLIQSAIDGGHRVLVFSQFTSMLALLQKDLNSLGIPFFEIEGSTEKLKRIELVDRFNAGEVPVFLISLKAGGTGLNLTGADIVIHYDPWWNVAVENQATGRAHRIGQKNVVSVYRLIARNTIEERIIELQQKKKDIADEILSGSNISLGSLTKEELLEILS